MLSIAYIGIQENGTRVRLIHCSAAINLTRAYVPFDAVVNMKIEFELPTNTLTNENPYFDSAVIFSTISFQLELVLVSELASAG